MLTIAHFFLRRHSCPSENKTLAQLLASGVKGGRNTSQHLMQTNMHLLKVHYIYILKQLFKQFL
jgi:hypothetical protein